MQKSRIHFLLSFVFVIFFACEYKDLPRELAVPDCSASNLSVSVFTKQDASQCNGIDGSITLAGAGGTPPYAFSINGGPYQTNTTFFNLGAGIYTLQIIDKIKCVRSTTADLFAGDSDLDAVVLVNADNECLTDNGSFSITPSGGTPPYQYQFGDGTFGSKAKFDSLAQKLKSGFYPVAIKDATGCSPKSVSVFVNRSITGVSFAGMIKPIIDTNCAISGCHNGDNGPTRNWTVFSLFQKNAQNVKTRTGNKSMPLGGHLTAEQIQLIACWVDDGALDN